jgi:hypothetical protein
MQQHRQQQQWKAGSTVCPTGLHFQTAPCLPLQLTPCTCSAAFTGQFPCISRHMRLPLPCMELAHSQRRQGAPPCPAWSWHTANVGRAPPLPCMELAHSQRRQGAPPCPACAYASHTHGAVLQYLLLCTGQASLVCVQPLLVLMLAPLGSFSATAAAAAAAATAVSTAAGTGLHRCCCR